MSRIEKLRVEELEPLQVLGYRVTRDQGQSDAEPPRHHVLQPVVAGRADRNFRPADAGELGIGVHQALQWYGGPVHAGVARQQSREGIRNRLQVI